MDHITRILLISVITFFSNPTPSDASGTPRTWNSLLESSEIIASAFLTKINSDIKNNKHVAYFEIDRVYKGKKIKNIAITSGAVRSTGSVYLNKLGSYIIFLKKSEGPHSNYSLEPGRFLKCNYLRGPNGKLIEAVDEKSHVYLIDIPNELFNEEEIRLTVYGKQFDYKAKIINFRLLERWLEKTFLNWKN